MDEAQSVRQIQQMVNFILNEAKDKAEEIDAKTLEEFNVEKLKYVQGQKVCTVAVVLAVVDLFFAIMLRRRERLPDQGPERVANSVELTAKQFYFYFFVFHHRRRSGASCWKRRRSRSPQLRLRGRPPSTAPECRP